MNNDKQLESAFIDFLKENASGLPYIAQNWEIKKTERPNINISKNEYGHYKTNSKNSIPFYKPISKIIDISKLS